MAKDTINLAELIIAFDALGSYDGIIESAVDLFEKDGIYEFQLAKYDVQLSGKDGDSDRKYMAVLHWTCLDEDAKGKKAISRALLSGVDSNGKPLFRQLIDVMVAGGFEEGKVQEYIKGGQKVSVESLLKALETKYNKAHFEVKRTVYEGKPRTDLARPVAKDKAKKAKEDGMHRFDIPATIAAGGGAGSATTNFGGATAKPNGAQSATKSLDI
jgi:hypothetical protein